MITFNNASYIGGRFGNQLFKYASLIGIAKKNGYEYGIPYREIPCTNDKAKVFYDKFTLFDCFNLSAKDSSDLIYPTKFEFDGNYDGSFENISDNIDIGGYFQSEKYFLHCRDLILKEFTFKNEIVDKTLDYLRGFDLDNTVCIHARCFTDYESIGLNVDLDYYTNALSMFDKDKTIILISDDINKARSLLKFENKVVYSDNNYLVDFCIMTFVKHIIMSNSTFSWWGSWLNNRSDKIIVAPKEWYPKGVVNFIPPWVDKPYQTNDIYCPNWVLV